MFRLSHGFYFSAVCFREKHSSTKRDAHGSRRVVTRSVNPLKRFDVRNEIINGSNIVHANGNLCSFTMLINRESLVISQQARLEYNNVTTHTYEPIIAFHLATGFVGRRYTTPNTHFRVPILHALLTLLLKTLSFSLSLSIRYPPTTPIEIIASRFRLRFCPIVDASRSSTNVPNRRCLYRHDKAPDPRFSIKISYCKFHFFLRSRNESIDLATYRVYR